MRRELSATVVCSLLLLTGCVTTGIVAGSTSALNSGGDAGTVVDPAQIGQFQAGKATASDVKAKLGEPQQTAQNADGGMTLTYIHRERTSNTTSYVPFARWAGGEVTIKTTSVDFNFDRTGKLLDSNKRESSLNCRLGKCPDLPALSTSKS